MTKLCHNVDDHTILDEFDNEQSRLGYYPLDYLKIAVFYIISTLVSAILKHF